MLNRRETHDKAMNIAEKAFFLERREENSDTVKQLYAEAFEIEKKVADAFIQDPEPHEPSRSVTCRSAAWLAHRAGKPEQARYYAKKVEEYGISEIVEEVKELL